VQYKKKEKGEGNVKRKEKRKMNHERAKVCKRRDNKDKGA
jgi:hypothetical protein